MRIQSLSLQAFGHFTDYDIVLDNTKGFHLLYGPNEAGKSTIRRAIFYYLYGFPTQTDDAFLHDYKSLRIGGTLQNHNGDFLTFNRRKGQKNTMLDEQQQPLDDATIRPFLQGISQSYFENMFALNHETLREGGESLLQSDGRLGESLFSAASGIGMLRSIRKEMEENAGQLYKKRASKPKINELIKLEKQKKTRNKRDVHESKRMGGARKEVRGWRH